MAGASILIVEDERILAADLEERLESMGYRVAGAASTARGALQKADDLKPDLVLMDIQLEAGEDGVEAALQIKDRIGAPVIFLTAFSDDQVLARAKLSEPFGYLIKPVQARELKSTIEMALYKAEMEEKLRQTNRELSLALDQVKRLSGLLPICCNCKKIRDEKDYWHQVEEYVRDHSEAQFSHGICPQCARELYPELYGDK